MSLAIGALGAALGYLLSLPVYILTGPAILITVLGLLGMRLAIAPVVRDAALLMIGISIGAGVDAQVGGAILRWPLAFGMLALLLVVIMFASRRLLMRGFGYDSASAVLAATPGHLSFVLAMSDTLNLSVARIAAVQSVRLLSLTLIVPFVALGFGVELSDLPTPEATPMLWWHLGLLIIAGLVLGLVLQRLNVPAPLFIGGLFVSAVSQISALTPGPLHPTLTLAAFLTIGTLIGTRFSGISPSVLNSLAAGLATTGLALGLALIASIPVAAYLDMPLPHVLVAFAPGGLETMVAMGAVLGANPGFVAAAHVARLLILIVLVPVFLARADKKPG